MYRIELAPDDIGVFRSIEEMAMGIRSGVITTRARIFHQASDKWLPIEFHPHYKKALEIANSAPASVVPLAPVLPGVAAPVLTAAATSGVAMPEEEEPEAPVEGPAVMAELDPEPTRQPVARTPRLRIELAHGKPRRPFVLALSGMMIAATAQFGLDAAPRPPWDLQLGMRLPMPSLPALSLPLIKWPTFTLPRPALPKLELPPALANATSRPPEPPSGAAPAAAPAPVDAHGTPSFGGSSAASTPAPAGTFRLPLRAAAPPAATAADSTPLLAPAPAASEIAAGAALAATPRKEAMSPTVLATRYQAAYATARAELETGLRTAGFANLVSIGRLDSGDGVRAARRSVTTASAYIAKYHRREREIEAAYADSAAVLAKQLGWGDAQLEVWQGRKVLAETPAVTKLTDFLLESLDSLYNVLLAEEGAYELRPGAIAFQNPKAARAYTELRPWLDPKAHAWADSGSAGAAAPTTAARVLRAMGPSSLPDGGGF